MWRVLEQEVAEQLVENTLQFVVGVSRSGIVERVVGVAVVVVGQWWWLGRVYTVLAKLGVVAVAAAAEVAAAD